MSALRGTPEGLSCQTTPYYATATQPLQLCHRDYATAAMPPRLLPLYIYLQLL